MACIVGMSSRTLRLLSPQLSMACAQFTVATTKILPQLEWRATAACQRPATWHNRLERSSQQRPMVEEEQLPIMRELGTSDPPKGSYFSSPKDGVRPFPLAP